MPKSSFTKNYKLFDYVWYAFQWYLWLMIGSWAGFFSKPEPLVKEKKTKEAEIHA